MKSLFKLLSAVAIFLIIAACSENDSEQNFADPKKEEVKEAMGEIAFDVKAAKVVKDDLVISINTNGHIKANSHIEVTSKISEIITRLHIKEGSRVKKGDLLIELDDREYQLAYEEAEASLTRAKVELALLYKSSPIKFSRQSKADSIKSMLDELNSNYNLGKINKKDYQEQKESLELNYVLTGVMREDVLKNRSGYTSALNSLKRAKLNLEYTKIKAPFSGVISGVDLSRGQRISAGQKLFELIDLSALRVEAFVIESEAANISMGADSKIRVSALGNGLFTGSVESVSPSIDKEAKTCKVIVKIDNPSKQIFPGMYSELLIETERLKDVILVPRDAMLVRDNRTLIFMAENSLAKWNYVTPGRKNEKFIQILEGKNQPVEEGMEVLVDGHFTLDHDAKINIVDLINPINK